LTASVSSTPKLNWRSSRGQADATAMPTRFTYLLSFSSVESGYREVIAQTADSPIASSSFSPRLAPWRACPPPWMIPAKLTGPPEQPPAANGVVQTSPIRATAEQRARTAGPRVRASRTTARRWVREVAIGVLGRALGALRRTVAVRR
jgi:hypothetical protein